MKKSLQKTLRLLTFRLTREEMLSFDRNDLIFGMLCTWVVGMGRYWDDPSAKLLQHLGAGSVGYVLAMSAMIWLVMWPLKPSGLSYFRTLCFVSMTSLPALFYAIPVERFFSMDTSIMFNAYFLLAVATWRVALLITFMKRFLQTGIWYALAVAFFPITLIISALSYVGSQHVVMQAMGGFRGMTGPFDITVWWISLLSMLVLVPATATYIFLVVVRHRHHSSRSRQSLHRG
jgi:hypothetical protein